MICMLCKKDSNEFKTIELKNTKIHVCLKCVIEMGSTLIKQAYEKYEKTEFKFGDIILRLDVSSMRVVIKHIDLKDLPIALKYESQEVIDYFKENMSSRAVQILQDEMSYLGVVREKDVECFKEKIVEVIMELEEKGEILIRSDK
jgi:flagellar motor switch protein FliG